MLALVEGSGIDCVCLQNEGQESEGGEDKRREGKRLSVIPGDLL